MLYYQRVKSNRLRRLRARRRTTPPPQAQNGECPVCNETLPVSRLQRHALRCLKRTGAELDEDVPDTSSEEGSIDVEVTISGVDSLYFRIILEVSRIFVGYRCKEYLMSFLRNQSPCQI